MLDEMTDWIDAMDHQMVRHGQNICQQRIQPPRPLRLDDDGVSRILDAALRYEHVAAEGWNR